MDTAVRGSSQRSLLTWSLITAIPAEHTGLAPQKGTHMPEKEIVIEIALERLRDFPGSPFRVTQDEPMNELIKSIQTYGILNPLIVRPMPDSCYQIISGHRRKFAARKLGYRKVPVIIRVLNDDEALVAMVDANLQREKIRIPKYSGPP